MKELKKVTAMLGTMLTKEEIEDFMREADVVRYIISSNIQNSDWSKINILKKESFKNSLRIFVNPSLVGGGRKVVAPSFKSSSAVNFDFHDPKPV